MATPGITASPPWPTVCSLPEALKREAWAGALSFPRPSWRHEVGPLHHQGAQGPALSVKPGSRPAWLSKGRRCRRVKNCRARTFILGSMKARSSGVKRS